MKLVIVDDEPLARERLRRMVEALPGWEVAAEADSGASGLARIRESEPDAVLLDIHMPGIDGLQVARAVAADAVPPAVIFVTAHSEHALSAHEAGTEGYLLKPVRAERLAEALARACRPRRAQLQTLDASPAVPPARRFIHGTARDRLVRVPLDDVIYFFADRKYTTVHHLHGRFLIEDSLRSLEDDLGEMFLRVHRKALVARRFVAGLIRHAETGAALTLRHAEKPIPVSRRRLPEVRELLKASDE